MQRQGRGAKDFLPPSEHSTGVATTGGVGGVGADYCHIQRTSRDREGLITKVSIPQAWLRVGANKCLLAA